MLAAAVLLLSQSAIDPAAQQILDQTAAAYQSASTLQFEMVQKGGNGSHHVLIRFKRPDGLDIVNYNHSDPSVDSEIRYFEGYKTIDSPHNRKRYLRTPFPPAEAKYKPTPW